MKFFRYRIPVLFAGPNRSMDIIAICAVLDPIGGTLLGLMLWFPTLRAVAPGCDVSEGWLTMRSTSIPGPHGPVVNLVLNLGFAVTQCSGTFASSVIVVAATITSPARGR